MLTTPRSPAGDWSRRNFSLAQRLRLLFRDRPMTARVLALLWTTFSTFACLYPPWTARIPVSGYAGRSLFLGYAPIWYSPEIFESGHRFWAFASVDFSRLALEIIVAGLALASLYLALGIGEQLRQTETTNTKSATGAQ